MFDCAYIFIGFMNKYNIHDFIKQFSSQIRIGYLGRVWVPNLPMDVRIGLKNLNPMVKPMVKLWLNQCRHK